MKDLDSTLFYPVRDEYARKQFVIAALLMLANMIIPLLPMLLLMGYSARIMRRIIIDGKEPLMMEWQGTDWRELLREGLRLFGVRLIFGLPSIVIVGLGLILAFGSPFLMASSSNDSSNPLVALGGVSLISGLGILLLGLILSLPIGLMLGAAESHAVAHESFQAGLRVREWWPIFRKNSRAFIGAYIFTIVAGTALSIITQIAAVTLVLLCIVPFLSIGYSAYILLVRNALVAQAYAAGQKQLPVV